MYLSEKSRFRTDWAGEDVQCSLLGGVVHCSDVAVELIMYWITCDYSFSALCVYKELIGCLRKPCVGFVFGKAWFS